MEMDVNPERLADTFDSLVRIDSVSGHEAELAKELTSRFAGLGGDVYVDNSMAQTGSDTGNLIVTFQGEEHLSPVLFSAHMDVVEPGKGVVPVFENGIFTSKGNTILGADDKSAIAVLLEVARVLHESGRSFCPVEFAFSTCEEIGLLGAKAMDYTRLKSRFGYVLDGSDPEGVVTKAPAANHIYFTLHGKSAHAGAEPEKGINAITLAARAIAGLELGRIDDETTCNLGVIHGGMATNIIPALVKVDGEARSHDPEKLETVTRTMIRAFQDAAQTWPGQNENQLPKVDVEIDYCFLHTHIPEDANVVQLVKKAGAAIGLNMYTRTSGGGSDANVFSHNGIPACVLGTGMKKAHTSEEEVALSDMVACARLVLSIIMTHSSGTL